MSLLSNCLAFWPLSEASGALAASSVNSPAMDATIVGTVGYPILWKDAKENEDPYGNRWALVKIGGQAPAMGVWKNSGYVSVGPHEHFQTTGVGADAGHPTVVVGTQPTDHFGPDYFVNGSQEVVSGQYGVYQRSDQLYVALKSSGRLKTYSPKTFAAGTFQIGALGRPAVGNLPEPGEYLGPVPGMGAAARHYPPTCRTMGIVDSTNGIALAESYRPWQRFKLREPLYECGTAQAQIMGRFGYTYATLDDYASDIVSDTLGAVTQSPLAVRDGQTGKLFIPAKKCLNARYARGPEDFWEAIDFAECACDPRNSSSSSFSRSSFSSDSSSISKSRSSSDSSFQSRSPSNSPSSQSTSQSLSSSKSGGSSPLSSAGSDGSIGSVGSSLSGGSGGSTGPGSSPSSGGSQQSSGGSAASDSVGSGGSGIDTSRSTSGVSRSQGSGSDKSTAIVPASWSPTGYTALFIAEFPEVRFDDVIVAKVARANTYLPIDPRFMEVCEAGSVQVCGCVLDVPVAVGAAVDGDKVSLRFVEADPTQVVQVVLRLTGIRKGFGGQRFPDRTSTQFEANERFIRSAYADE